MPTAPMAQRQVVDQPFPNIRVGAAPTADTLGGQIGETVAHAGVRFYDLETRAANQTAVFEADRQLADKQTELENKLYATKGKGVLGADTALQKEFDDQVRKIEEGLSNDQQRGAFQRTYLMRKQQLNESMQKHIRTEYGAFQDAETQGTIDSARDRTRRNPDSPTIVPQERQRALSALGAWAARKGLIGEITPEMVNDPQFQQSYLAKGQTPPTLQDLQDPTKPKQFVSEAFKEKRQVVESGLHKEVVDGLLAQDNDQAAKAYAEKNRANFTAADLDLVEKSVEEGSTRGESRRQTQEILAKTGIETPEQRREALKAVDRITNDKVADATRTRLEHQFSVYDQRKREGYDHAFMTSSKIVEDQGLKRPAAGIRDLIPVPLWNSLEPKDQAALELHLARVRKPTEHAHEPKVWYDFETLTTKQLANVSKPDLLRTYLNHFDGTHYDRALNEYQAAISAEEKGGAKFIQALTPREEIMNAWVNSGIVDNSVPRAKWSKADETNYNRFESQAAQALSQLPKDAKPEVIQQVLHGLSDALLKQKYIVDPGLFRFNKEVPAIGLPDVTGARSIRIPLEQISVDRQNELKGALKSAGLPTTQQNIEELEAKSRMKKQGIVK
jgi:hypothetical protein